LKKDVFTFSLLNSEQVVVATFRCEDRSNLVWWMHGFQRRIFEQTKGFLRKLRVVKGQAQPVRIEGENLEAFHSVEKGPTTAWTAAACSAVSLAIEHGEKRRMREFVYPTVS
jgi:hypothetical protein